MVSGEGCGERWWRARRLFGVRWSWLALTMSQLCKRSHSSFLNSLFNFWIWFLFLCRWRKQIWELGFYIKLIGPSELDMGFYGPKFPGSKSGSLQFSSTNKEFVPEFKSEGDGFWWELWRRVVKSLSTFQRAVVVFSSGDCPALQEITLLFLELSP